MRTTDILVIGGGPAGLTAAIYGARAQLKTLVVERLVLGGQLATTELVENYPGFPEPITGPEIIERMEKQARNWGAEIVYDTIASLRSEGDLRYAVGEAETYEAKAIVVATGSTPRKLGIPGENELTARGICYCATCDGPLFRGKTVAVAGGGNTACQEGFYLTRFVQKLYLIHRRDQLRAEKVLQERVLRSPKVEPIWNSVVIRANGRERLQSLTIKNVKTNEESELRLDGLFVFIGTQPNSDFLRGFVELNPQGYVIADADKRTSVEGVFVAGDVADWKYQQAVSAAGDGCMAAMAARRYIEGKFA